MKKPKPVVKLVGENGNVMNLLAVCTKAMKAADMALEAGNMRDEVFNAGSYDEALQIMMKHCEVE